MALDIITTQRDQGLVVLVTGEIDVSCADELRDAIDSAFEQKLSFVTVDLAQVPYIDSTGIGVLVGAAHRALDEAIEFSVTNPQRNVKRVLDLLGVTRELGIVAEA